MMKILITNDDGIYAPGIVKLAETALNFGEVFVVAPEGQCSAMSHRITIFEGIKVTEVSDFPVKGVAAYSIGGTPADCVKIAVEYLMDEKPDIVLSGINKGYNAGMDISYSGTVAAAMEAIMKGIPAIAFSMFFDEDYALIDEKLYEIMKELFHKSPGQGRMWNVNFPGCKPEQCKGILWNRTLAKAEFHPDVYGVVEKSNESTTLMLLSQRGADFEGGTDLHALVNGYISIGTITNMVMGQ